MTTRNKKEEERRTLDHLLWALDVQTSSEPEEGETPDFIVLTRAGRIGIEVTTFQSGVLTDDGVPRRNAEGAWEVFEVSADEFRKTKPHLRDLNVWLGFKASCRQGEST